MVSEILSFQNILDLIDHVVLFSECDAAGGAAEIFPLSNSIIRKLRRRRGDEFAQRIHHVASY